MMRRKLLVTTTILLMVTSATALVGHNNSSGDVSITSSSGSASAKSSVGPNGTEYTARLHTIGTSQNNTQDQVSVGTISASKINFTGTIQAPNPCHVIEQNVTETESGYTMNIETIPEGSGQVPCIQVVTGINYEASFEADEGFDLEVKHNGETVENFQTTSDSGDQNSSDKKSWLERILDFLGL